MNEGPPADGGGGEGGGPSLPEMPSLPEDAAGRAFDALAGIVDAFNEGVYGLGRRLSEALPMALDVVTGLL